jgi:hypothetical protein
VPGADVVHHSLDYVLWLAAQCSPGGIEGLSHLKYDATNLVNPFHPSCRDATATRSGVYKIDAKTRKVTALATRADAWPFCFPDDVAIDSQSNVYLTDLTYSAIWKIWPDGKKVDLWSAIRALLFVGDGENNHSLLQEGALL